MSIRLSGLLILVEVLLIFLVLTMSVSGQSRSKSCGNSERAQVEKVLLEITREGHGMIVPTVPQLFFRLHDNGLLEYEVITRREVRARHQRLNRAVVSEIQELLESRDLLDAKQEYPLLEDFKDAVMKTCIRYEQGNHYGHILVMNYMPGNPKAKSYYPPSLMKLLERIESIRPSTNYEHRYGLDKLSY